jgi:hypothetical protein
MQCRKLFSKTVNASFAIRCWKPDDADAVTVEISTFTSGREICSIRGKWDVEFASKTLLVFATCALCICTGNRFLQRRYLQCGLVDKV